MIYTCAPHPLRASLSTAFSSACEIVSKRSSGPRSGSHSPSHVPKSWSLAVPETMKSFAKSMQPIESNLSKSALAQISHHIHPLFIPFVDIPANKRLPTRLINPRNNRTHKPRPKPALIQTTADQIREGLRADIPLLPQAIHVHFVAEELGDRADVRRQPGQAQVGLRAVGEDFGEVVADGEGLEPEAQVAGDGYAVFACHCYAGAAVCEGVLVGCLSELLGGGLRRTDCER